jgi:group I intron endonuclease
MRDVNAGWALRYTHANVASFFFLFVYAHIARGLYYSSYRTPRSLAWTIGVIILILMMATAFLGYSYSPKWFNINIFYLYVLFPIFLYIYHVIILKIIENKSKKEHIIKQLKYNKVKIELYNKKNIIGGSTFLTNLNGLGVNQKKNYTSCCIPTPTLALLDGNHPKAGLGWGCGCNTNNGVEISDRLKEIIKELGLNPVYNFENLNLENTRKQVFKDTKDLSGIYMIVNKTTKDSRFSNHLIYFRGSKIVKLAVKKYNLENFGFLILELYPNIVTKKNNKELIDLEDKYLKLLLPNYNILTEAGSSFGYKHTEIDRLKMKDIYTEARREKIGSLNRGKNLSPEIIDKIREKALKRPPMSEETKQKCIKHTRPITLYNLDNTIYGEYFTILDAAKAINCNEKTIRRALQTEKKLVKKQWIVKDSKNESKP